MTNILRSFFKWAWSLIGNITPLFEWLVSPINVEEYPLFGNILSLLGLSEIAPIYIVGGGAILTGGLILIIGLIRAIA